VDREFISAESIMFQTQVFEEKKRVLKSSHRGHALGCKIWVWGVAKVEVMCVTYKKKRKSDYHNSPRRLEWLCMFYILTCKDASTVVE
jgi:hypothetical protein